MPFFLTLYLQDIRNSAMVTKDSNPFKCSCLCCHVAQTAIDSSVRKAFWRDAGKGQLLP